MNVAYTPSIEVIALRADLADMEKEVISLRAQNKMFRKALAQAAQDLPIASDAFQSVIAALAK